MKLRLLEIRDSNIGKNNDREDFWRKVEGEGNRIWYA